LLATIVKHKFVIVCCCLLAVLCLTAFGLKLWFRYGDYDVALNELMDDVIGADTQPIAMVECLLPFPRWLG
jgi:hypothetical protein